MNFLNLRMVSYVLLILSITGCATQHIATEIKTHPKPLAVFIADNQHIIDRGAKIFEQGKFVAGKAKTARRSALNNLFDLDVISFIIEHESQACKDSFPVIHLGDALNNSCKEEWFAFQKTMQNTKKEWFIVPGNHDSYYLGISYPNASYGNKYAPLDSRVGWGCLCTPWSKKDINGVPASSANIEKVIFDKRDFISAYKTILEKRPGTIPHKQVINHSGYIEKENGFLKRAFWSFSDKNNNDEQKGKQKVWEDFIVQDVRLKNKPVSLILVDTVSSIEKPMSKFSIFNIHSFPLYGDLKTKQSEIIDSWLKENHENNITSIMVGHHPFKNLSKNSQYKLKQWAKYGYFDTYISAHTHSGENIKHEDFLEINIGSLVDAPIEYMTFVENNAVNKNPVDIHHNFLTQRTTDQMQKRLSNLIDFSWSDKSCLCSDKEMSNMEFFKNKSFRKFTEGLHTNSRKGQKNSLLQEIEIYLQIIKMREDLFKINNESDIIPICYRTYPSECKENEGKLFKCLKKSELDKICMTTNDNKYANKRIIKSFLDIEQDLKKNKDNLQDAIKTNSHSNKRIIEASRLLDAIDRFIDKNITIIADFDYTHMKACLSIVASELKETKD